MTQRKARSPGGLRVVREGERHPSARPELARDGRWERTFVAMARRIAEARTVVEADRLQLGALHPLCAARATFISRWNEQRQQLQISFVRGRNHPRVAACGPGEGPVGAAFATRRIVRAEGLIAVPLFSELSAASGCLVLVEPREDLPDALLEAAAAQIVAATEVAQLRDEAEHRTKDLETAVAGLKGLERGREELLANVSHELKNPLTAIKTSLTRLERGSLGSLDPKARQAVELCQRNADRLLRMINDLLLISRLEAGEMELDERPFGLKALVEEALRALASLAEPAQVELRLGPAPEAFVRGERARILDAVTYLLENAVRTTRVGGTVQVTLGSAEHGLVRLAVHDQAGEVRQQDLDHAFDTFYRPEGARREKRAGAELGLPVAAKIVRLHGGRVTATVRPGEGATVEMLLPAFAAAVTPAEAPATARDGDILLVEDDADCREVLGEVLREEGYRVVSVSTCRDALAALEAGRPALVLLDLRLSDGDGRRVLQRIRQTPSLAGVPVHVISGASDAAEIAAQLGTTVDGLLEKPLHVGRLLDVVSAAVRPAF
jgi:signal transduction histidine kinase/CheY-like chemotaxis protein